MIRGEKMPALSHDDGVETFGPHLADLADLTHASIQEFYEKYSQDFHELEGWTKASIIRDKIVTRLKRYCAEPSGLQPIRKGNASYFGFHSKYLVKVKRLGADFSVNLPATASSTLFDSQEWLVDQGELLEGLAVTTVYVGYVPTENAPLNPPVFIVCKNKQRKVAWVIECKPADPLVPDELAPRRPDSGAPPTQVKVKRSHKSGTDG